MSDTPRTDGTLEILLVQLGTIDRHNCPEQLVVLARKLEVELNAANERVKRLEEAVEILVAFGNQLGDELYPPDRNCSCHILPPCQDCEQWDSQRVAKSDWANAVERANKAKEATR